ncbi:MAG: hypothetical protein ACUVSY_17595 [Roseiflexus sp.]
MSSGSGEPPSPGARQRSAAYLLRATLPHAVTALVAIVLTLGIQRLLLPVAPGQLPATPPVASMTPVPSPMPTPATDAALSPQPTEAPLAAALTRQEVIDLRAQDERLWAAMYLMRALHHLADAEASLRINDFARVEQTLAAVDEALAKAYARAAEADRDPIAQIRSDVGGIREDLYLRPEGMDIRLARMRQSIMTLIDARQ